MPGRWRRRVVVMVKAPLAGRVKSRLARDVGWVAATTLYRHMASGMLRRIAGDPRWETWLAVTPDGALGASYWPARLPRMPQGGGDLGTRMQRIMDRAPPGPVLVIGTDIPGVRPAHLWRAFHLLGRHDAVLGPTHDGGFWLVGFRRSGVTPRPFNGVRWSSEHALADTIDKLRGSRIALADRLRDVDEAGDLRPQVPTSS